MRLSKSWVLVDGTKFSWLARVPDLGFEVFRVILEIVARDWGVVALKIIGFYGDGFVFGCFLLTTAFIDYAGQDQDQNKPTNSNTNNKSNRHTMMISIFSLYSSIAMSTICFQLRTIMISPIDIIILVIPIIILWFIMMITIIIGYRTISMIILLIVIMLARIFSGIVDGHCSIITIILISVSVSSMSSLSIMIGVFLGVVVCC